MGKDETKGWCSLWITLATVTISTIFMIGIFLQAGQL